ncbi:MAG TPA: phage holin family protein [Polyangiaceae bacterium]
MNTVTREPSVKELFGDLARETGTLVRKEVRLAQVEMTEKATFAGKQAAFIAAGGAVGIVGMLSLVAALILGLGTLIPLWTSALLVGAVFVIAAVALAEVGVQRLKKLDPTPHQTISELKETSSWAQRQLHHTG